MSRFIGQAPCASAASMALLCVLSLAGCATVPPSNISDACSIFSEKPKWYKATRAAEKKWGTPVQVQLAIIHQESAFKAKAKPPRGSILWFFPGPRPSSAYGYAQVKDETWDWYVKKTGSGGADRDDFKDAVDFVAWYVFMTNRELGVSKWDAYNQYLAYHEGHGGYKQGSYKDKKWLIPIAKKVQNNAELYASQLKRCKDSLEGGWFPWPF